MEKKPVTYEKLMSQYWGITVPMVLAYNEKHGTKVKPSHCVKFNGMKLGYVQAEHLTFPEGKIDGSYEFALTILGSKPVFVGDVLYRKENSDTLVYGPLRVLGEHELLGFDVILLQSRTCEVTADLYRVDESFSWTPPQKKRTFDLNGEELPCPDARVNEQHFSVVIGSTSFRYKNPEDQVKVYNALKKLMTDARCKE